VERCSREVGYGGQAQRIFCLRLRFSILWIKGFTCSITAGAWGSRFDFDFDDTMLADRRYCLWSGRLGMERPTRNFSFSASGAWASHLRSEAIRN
jgi:hypothetical protein